MLESSEQAHHSAKDGPDLLCAEVLRAKGTSADTLQDCTQVHTVPGGITCSEGALSYIFYVSTKDARLADFVCAVPRNSQATCGRRD